MLIWEGTILNFGANWPLHNVRDGAPSLFRKQTKHTFSIMADQAELQTLLRFLSKDARLPLQDVLPKVQLLRKADLGSVEEIGNSDLKSISAIFTDEKQAKQVFNAAKRVTKPKKRSATDASTPTASKLMKGPDGSAQPSAAALELPVSDMEEEVLKKTALQTNRAPLVLAFAVTLLKYTMPEQPISSRLSLAQAIVSANSQSKAKSIGLANGSTAEEDGWGKGQPKIKVLGREIAVMRRAAAQETEAEDETQKDTKPGDTQQNQEIFWGLDLDVLRKSNGPLTAGKNSGSGTGLPIYTPESARNYLLRSMKIIEDEIKSETNIEAGSPKAPPPKQKPTAKETAAAKEQAAAHLLQALDMLFQSWSHLSKDELDRRAWSWYLHVRPDIAQGQAGWGQKGQVKLADILKLRKEAVSS